ncbi:MAG: cobalamin-dependent protein [Anaerolineae bacterium]|nr:cobalamin-dependent protein [Anaerolineae bacterium]
MKRKTRPSKHAQTPQVLYIHPAKQGVDFQSPGGASMGRPYGLMPVGVAALVNVLRQEGISVTGINLPMEKHRDPAFDLAAWLRQHADARIVLIDMHWYEHTYGAISVAQAVKQTLPRAWTVLGGLSATAFARDILTHFDEVDFVIKGDAEKPLLDLARRLLQPQRNLALVPNLVYRENGQIVENEQSYCAATEDLDRLNFVDIDFIEHVDEYYVHEYIVTDLQAARGALDKSRFRGRWLCNARGCKYNCSYCGGCKSAHKTLAGRDGIVPRSPAKMIDDLERLVQNRVIQASMSYDLAELGEAYWCEFFDRLRRSQVKIGLYNELFQLPQPDFIDTYAGSVDVAQSCVALSPLSGSEQVRRLNGKQYSNDALFGVLNALKRHNLSIFVYFSLNLPGENEETVIESIDLAREIADFYPNDLLKIITSCHTIDPLCPMGTDPDEYGVQVDMTSFMDFYTYCRDTQLAGEQARTEAHRGFRPADPQARSLARMADLWDAARVGHENCWWPVPPSW